MGHTPARIQEHDKIKIARAVSMGLSLTGMSPLASAAGGTIANKVLDKFAPSAIKSFAPILVPPMDRMPGGGMPIRML
jgi:hypothetical protein